MLKCFESLRDVMSKELPEVAYEHIFANHCSTYSTVEKTKRFLKSDSRVKLVVNCKNIGAPCNINSAFSRTSGLAVIPMLPADFQDPAEVIPDFYREWKAGSLIIFCQKIEGQESFVMRSLKSLYYRIIKKMALSDNLINDGEFMLIDRKVVDFLVEMRESNPHLREHMAQVGVKSSSVNYRWGKREFGKSKAKPFVSIDTAIKGLVSTSRLPARITLLSEFMFSLLGIVLGVWPLLDSFFSSTLIGSEIQTIIVGTFFIGGIQLFFLGLLGEYVLNIHREVRPEPGAFDLETVKFEKLEVRNRNER